MQALYEDRSGTFWVGTYGGGLNRFDRDSERFTPFTEKENLPNNVIYGILEDSLSFLWLSTNKGLSKFDPKTVTFRNYDVHDGLQSNEFNSGAFHKSRGGEMFFGGINGFNAFYPDRIKDNRYVPPVVLTSFKKLNKEAVLDTAIFEISVITLQRTDDVISFEFAALDYTVPEKNQYAYQLEGFSEDWITLGTKRDVTFTNLDPGSYTLRVKGSNNDGLWNEAGLAVRLIVVPPFWQTWWFRTAGVLAVTALLLTVYLARTRRYRAHNRALRAEITERWRAEAELETKNEKLEAQNAELERFTYTVSHDLKAPLVTIKGFLGVLQQDAARGDTEGMNRAVALIEGAADKMARLLGELLELSRIGRLMNPPEAVSPTELARDAAELVAGEIKKRSVTVEIESDMPVVLGDRVRLLEVYQNLIDNAVKFMGDQPAPHVEITARVNGEEVLCAVRDNGVGIAPKYHEKGAGNAQAGLTKKICK